FGLTLGLPEHFALLGNVSTAVKFNITNAGNGLDFLELNLSGDWIADEMQLLTLAPLETREIAVLANPGLVETGTSSALSVSVRSLTAAEAGQTAAESGTLTLIASGLLPASAEILELAPGESGSFLLGMVVLHSDGKLRLELNGAAADWALSDPADDGNGFALPLGQPQMLQVHVTIPAGTATGDYLLQIHAWDQAVPEAISEVNLTVRVTRSWGLTLLQVSTPGALEPGTQGIWLLDIGNSGNGVDTVNLTVEGLPADWTTVFSPQPVSVAADNSKAVTLRLTLPAGAAAGEHNFSVHADSAGANTTIPLNLTVTAQYALEVNLTREAEQTGAPGDMVYYSFLVLNSGNSNDTALVQVSGNMYSQGNGQLDWAVKPLDASASADNVLRVTVPTGSGPWTATLTVKSQADPALVETFELTLRSQAVPDVQLAELEMYPSQPQAGDSVQVSVTVISIDADLDSVYVSIWLDGQQIHGEWVNGLTANYYDKELTASFTAKSGSHVLQVVADPDNAVVESVETNNELEHHFSVEAE
ncbi:MAG: CARDB domain-containing protein, partial [Candidatus Thermoplasmatota archaeon]|nr:CARDB domain-containing protein [Candidatus Thermoplasmatota archaeon]